MMQRGIGRTPRRQARRGAAALAAAGAAALLVAGCGGGSGGPEAADAEPAPASREPGEQVDLTFWSWVPGVDKAVDLWNSENPDVQVKLEQIPTGSAGGYAKMYSALEAGEGAPDLAQVEYQEVPGFLLEGGLVDLAEYGAEEHQDEFVDWQWQQGVFGDGVYAIPQASGPMAMFYREDLFTQWGIEVPTTWEEFRAAAEAVRAADPEAYISTFPPGNSAWFASLAWQNGGQWFGIDGETWTVDIDNEQTREVAEYWDGMVRDGLVKTDPDFANGWYSDLQSGRIVGWVGAQWGDAILAGNAPDTAGKWRVAPMPQWEEDGEFASANWGGSSTAVLTGTEYPTEAMEFAVWLNTDPESIDLLVEGGYGWPAAADALEGSTLDREYEFFGGQKINDVFAEADQAIDRDWSWIPTTAAAYQHLNDGFQRAIAGEGSFVETLEEAQRETVADLEAKGLQVDAP
ncbi:extracellular solute-binding protein [Georgenia sp. TF02-10]|uniref:extracellular solute-binding protein n=1 Tax=Georgenia sp. TF02-10 TaxID=2917725 RepID=UPI001FA717E4|nr:extracellular solute-binding protein [Georgenia sp. TF02-10]UNX56165.1 extracellular solute-binding protein [Georgenia sp. TF02-10]